MQKTAIGQQMLHGLYDLIQGQLRLLKSNRGCFYFSAGNVHADQTSRTIWSIGNAYAHSAGLCIKVQTEVRIVGNTILVYIIGLIQVFGF